MTNSLDVLTERIGYKFIDESLLITATRHSSWIAENNNVENSIAEKSNDSHDGFESNERLEFLGDAVLGWVVADIMYRRYPDFDEGDLTDMRKVVVNTIALGEVATQLGLGEFVMLGRGEEAGGGREKTSILANALEAVIGAVYLDSSSQRVYSFVALLFSNSIDEALAALSQLDAKSQLQELTARLSRSLPEYRVTHEGPDHAKMFHADVYIDNESVGSGSGRTKKAAEQQAAQQAFAAWPTS